MASRAARLAAWVPLVLLLAGCFALALGAAPSPDRFLAGDEATYLMQAESLAFDRDLAYSPADLERFTRRHGEAPRRLILEARHAGRPGLVYGVPALYALWLAPFLLFVPLADVAPLANALLLLAAGLVTARTLARRMGPAGPIWTAAFLFGSVVFAYVFRVRPDLLLVACVAGGYALAWGGEPPPADGPAEVYAAPGVESPARFRLRWLTAGLLVAVPAVFSPLGLLLLVPLAFAVPAERWREGRALLAAGALLLLAGSTAAGWASGGPRLPWSGEPRVFTQATGFPAAGAAQPAVGGEAVEPAVQWPLPGGAAFWGWSLVGLAVGRDVGLLPYFLPLLLALCAPTGGERGRRLLLWVAALGVLGALLLHPFNFAGGPGAIANRRFLPFYAALWFRPARPARPVRPARMTWALAVVVAAAPFLWPLWAQPAAALGPPDGGARYVSALARRFLPYETTQQAPAGEPEVRIGRLRARLLGGGLTATSGGDRLALFGDREGELLLASPTELKAVTLDFEHRATAHLEVVGATVGQTLLRPDGTVVFELLLAPARALHPLAGSEKAYYVYPLRLRLAGARPQPLAFRIEPSEGKPADPDGRDGRAE